MNYLKLYIGFIVGISLLSCNDDFLQRPPLDEVTELDYFKNPDDLKTYVNQFYNSSMFPRYNNYGNDFDSDNEIGATPDTRLQGTRTVATSGSISFTNVRSINYFFDHYQRVKENNELDAYKQYLGEAYFFRALIYFNLLKTYGDIQWINTELGTNSPELYNPRDPRNKVADNIIAALDSAALFLTEDKTRGSGRVNKWMALLIQSRVALYEGTWEKYHAGTPFGVDDPQPQKYFQKAVDAAQQVMKSGLYDIYITHHPEKDYKDLFSLQSYDGNPEVMFWREYDNGLSRGDKDFTNDRNFRMETPSSHTITQQLADAYLCTDGKPISQSPRFAGHNTLKDEMQNRDPRFYQTIATPDEIWKIFPDGSKSYWKDAYSKLNTTADYNAPTGYLILKGYNPDMQYHVQQYEETPSILYRYAEALLNYAEAKAESGQINQDDIDISINKLRDRVGMPHLIISSIPADPNWDFPDLSPLLNEIRRERRIELALEGFRWDDIARWAAADELIIGSRPKGLQADQLDHNTFPTDENGFLDPFKNAIPNGYGFVPERDYLNSIPESEIVLNPDLEQNPGW
ncbi:RagB/SusD family nutrient uptake outer membrane protein [Compostibacter hankyongensis]|uniref:RagB/SusD family nutrient uptake outer membrane protein n=1 Tax=Compostibacter hankyongensis TaxID=1007089 RepID=A0ABP8G9N2_9BACT